MDLPGSKLESFRVTHRPHGSPFWGPIWVVVKINHPYVESNKVIQKELLWGLMVEGLRNESYQAMGIWVWWLRGSGLGFRAEGFGFRV